MDSHKKTPDPYWVQGSILGLTNTLLGLVDELRANNLIDSESLGRSIKVYEDMTIALRTTDGSQLADPLEKTTQDVMLAISSLVVLTAKIGREELIASVNRGRAKRQEKNKSNAEADDES